MALLNCYYWSFIVKSTNYLCYLPNHYLGNSFCSFAPNAGLFLFSFEGFWISGVGGGSNPNSLSFAVLVSLGGAAAFDT